MERGDADPEASGTRIFTDFYLAIIRAAKHLRLSAFKKTNAYKPGIQQLNKH